MLEAKLVVGDMVFSIATEFIENKNDEVEKQDCELKAFYRLASKVKKAFPRLNICILGDSLYACEPVFKVCKENNWEYIFRFKNGKIPTVAKEYSQLKELSPENKLNVGQWQMQWVNQIDYHNRQIHLCELEIIREDSHIKTQTFVYLTSFIIDKKNVMRIIEAGRSRWKIENEGFNRQKNHRLHIEHINSHNYVAMKIHYLMAQITEIIMVLYELGSDCFKALKKTIKEKSSDLLESFCREALTDEDIKRLEIPIKIRFT